MISESILENLLGLSGHRYWVAIGPPLHISFTLKLRSLAVRGVCWRSS